jgi:glutamine amidotransferase
MIFIIDYNLGNPESVRNILKHIGIDSKISNDPSEIRDASKLILPGVGNFKQGISNLHNMNLFPVLNELVLSQRIPILGICLGMQLLCDFSEEGDCNGLGWINANVLKFDKVNNHMKIPHMGWNYVNASSNNKLIITPELQRFYFVHKFYVKCNDSSNSVGVTDYFGNFTSMIQKDNIFGCQFHPEKSHRFGMSVLANFANL